MGDGCAVVKWGERIDSSPAGIDTDTDIRIDVIKSWLPTLPLNKHKRTF